jgi:hypothetical protein
MSFNRPDYLRQALTSLATQQDADIGGRDVFLFQDHWFNERSKREKAKARDIDACIEVFREIFPRGQVMAATENLGVAENFLRAETLFFREMKADCAYFLEDDLVLAPRYLGILDGLRDALEGTPEVGYFTAYGHLTATAEDQLRRRKMLRRIGHHWAFGLFRRHWEDMQPLMAEFYELTIGRDYKDRDSREILRRYRERDILVNVSSQDDVKKAVTYALGRVGLNTHLVNARYIGAIGLHMNQALFDEAGYARTVWVDVENPSFDIPDAEGLARLHAEELTWRRQVIADQAKPAAPAAPVSAAPAKPHIKPPQLKGPRMSAEERQLFERILASGRRRYAEFGVGGSTILAARQGFDTLVGVESDAAWAKLVRENEALAPAVAEGRATILHANIGEVGAWGSPVDRTAVRPWPNYIARMWEEWDRRQSFPDLVLVDGRFRVACCLSVALLAAAHRGRHPAPLVILHDVGEERPNYNRVLDFYHVEEAAGTLRVMSPRVLRSPEVILAAMLDRIFEVT